VPPPKVPSCCRSKTCIGPDDGSLDFLDHLCEVNRDVPMLMLCLSRPTLFERRPDWGSREEIHQRIDLDPLGTSDMGVLAYELLRKIEPSPCRAARTYHRTSRGETLSIWKSWSRC
jgi:hypothetical protein